MSAQEKESIFVELREYHLGEFPEVLSTPNMTNLRNEFAVIEDEIITMLLSLVNGKAEYVDHTEKLKSFAAKLKSIKFEAEEKADKELFDTKLEQLTKILSLASRGTFLLRKQKVPRISQSTKSVTTER